MLCNLFLCPQPHFSLWRKVAVVVTGNGLCYLRFLRYRTIFLYCVELNYFKWRPAANSRKSRFCDTRWGWLPVQLSCALLLSVCVPEGKRLASCYSKVSVNVFRISTSKIWKPNVKPLIKWLGYMRMNLVNDSVVT